MNDTDKLNLIQEHLCKYYNGREIFFTEGGFVQYSLSPSKQTLMVHEMYVSEDSSNKGRTMISLIKHLRHLETLHKLQSIAASVQLDNPYLYKLQKFYKSIRMEIYCQDSTSITYIRSNYEK